LGNDQKTFISKLMVEIEPSLMEQLNYFEWLIFFQAIFFKILMVVVTLRWAPL
jgi:hypothetical protein